MNRPLVSIALFAWGYCAGSSASAAELDLPANGWASWQVPTVAEAPAWCCFSSDSPAPCQLDDRHYGFMARDDRTTDTVRLYAHFTNRKLDQLRPLAADCPVQSSGEIKSLSLSEHTSAEWLAGLLDDHDADSKPLSAEIIAALAMHRAPRAYHTLARTAREDANIEHRKAAVFWLARLRGLEGAELTRGLMFNDADAQMRVHAAFVITQSKAPQIPADLIHLAISDRDPGVRGQAWFWLAHTGAPQTESAIYSALPAESNQHVREQAIFALSRLPTERATRALIDAVQNKQLTREDRKRAIFWLGQSDSESAVTYLGKVLDRSAP